MNMEQAADHQKQPLPLPLTRGDKGVAVLELQAQLAALGWLIVATGEYDLATERVVQEFQKASRLKVTGMVDAETRERIKTYYQWNRKDH